MKRTMLSEFIQQANEFLQRNGDMPVAGFTADTGRVSTVVECKPGYIMTTRFTGPDDTESTDLHISDTPSPGDPGPNPDRICHIIVRD